MLASHRASACSFLTIALAVAASARATAMSARSLTARCIASLGSSGSGDGTRLPLTTSGASGGMPTRAFNWSVAMSTRLWASWRPASSRFTSTSCRLSSSDGAAPSRTRLPTTLSPSRFTRRRSSVTLRFRCAARSSPAFMRTSARRRRSRSATCRRLVSSSRSATATRPSLRPLRSSGRDNPTLMLLSGLSAF